MATFFEKNKEIERPASFFTGGGDEIDDPKQTHAQRAPARRDGPQSGGFVGYDPDAINSQNNPNVPSGAANGTAPPPAQAPNFAEGDPALDAAKTAVGAGIFSNPIYQQLMQKKAENDQKLLALRTMPTYVTKSGQTKQGMEDKDGRVRSGLKGLIAGLAENFSGGGVRDWGDLYSRLSGSIARGVGGALVPEWNEWADRHRETKRLEEENKQIENNLSFQGKMATTEANVVGKQAQSVRADKTLELRVTRQQIQNLKEEQRMALAPVIQRGYYYEGDNPDEDAKLAGLNIILPDFDKTRKQITDNGVTKDWNPETRSYEQSAGTNIDPDDEPITFMADGEKITASRKNYLSYKAPIEASKVSAQNQSASNQHDYDEDVADLRGKIAAADSKIRSAQDKLSRLQTPQTKEDYESKEKAEKELSEAQAEKSGHETKLKNLPKPVKVASRGAKTTSKAQVEAYAKKKGISYADALKQAQNEGWTVQ